MLYCVYLTIYRGNKLPPFYIGSTSVAKAKGTYRGSVSSKDYKELWKTEMSNNPELFDIKIISYHQTRKDALDKEDYFHVKLGVKDNPLYINKARAIGCFGVFKITPEVKEKMSLASMGKKKSESHRNNIAEANRKKAKDSEFLKKLASAERTKEWNANISKSLKGKKKTKEHCEKLSKAQKMIKRLPCSADTKKAISLALKGNHPNPHKNMSYEEIYGKEKADELKKQRSLSLKQVRSLDSSIECPNCKITIKGKANYSRWHGDKCKQKI